MYRVVALDPGGTTGWASYTAERIHNGKAFEYYNETWATGQMGPEPHHLQLWNWLGLMQTHEFNIVCESFEYRNASRSGLELISVEYIGVARLFVQERNIDPVIFQTASMGSIWKNKSGSQSFVQPENIKKLGLWSTGQPHAMDALAHLLYYLTGVHKRYDILAKGWK